MNTPLLACTNKQINNLKHGSLFMQWDPWHTQRIEIIHHEKPTLMEKLVKRDETPSILIFDFKIAG